MHYCRFIKVKKEKMRGKNVQKFVQKAKEKVRERNTREQKRAKTRAKKIDNERRESKKEENTISFPKL